MVRSFIEWLRSPEQRTAAAETKRDQSPSEQEQPSLFQCPGCSTVYVAIEKSTCSACKVPIEEVARTRSTDAGSRSTNGES